ncbi:MULTISPECIES: hypothetical protein [Empedobacter]|uniref:Lipoprotein n=1 Tax=Empedobacter falsenii TaxID=343874 RepID=A0A7H9DRC9_9FLAO|nr:MULTISPECIES: hypothetical protein [Empedobacter]MDH2206985.1 hypothetical protein [Empedobacter sp. GD03644]QLL57727.1 hypothetical protein FH779_06385 [Empedobacter falsenii]
MKNINYTIILTILIIPIFFYSCKKSYERPDEYEVDLFKNERVSNDTVQMLTKEKSFEQAEIVIFTNEIKLLDSMVKQGKTPIYVYQLTNGKIEKGIKDSVNFPMNILSTRAINKSEKSTKIYLEDLKSFKLLVSDFDIKYQIIFRSPLSED